MKNVLRKEDTENSLGCVRKGFSSLEMRHRMNRRSTFLKNYTYFYVFLGEKPYFPRRAKKITFTP